MEITRSSGVMSNELRLKGRMEAATATIIESEIRKVIDEGVENIVLNMAEVEYLSSAGIRVIITCLKALQAKGGSLRVAYPSSAARMVLDLTGLGYIVD